MIRAARTSRASVVAPGLRRSIWGAAARTTDLTTLSDIDCPPPSFDGATTTQVTTLANGLKVASSDLSLPGTTVGVYIDTGSSYESVGGTAHVLQHMAFKVRHARPPP